MPTHKARTPRIWWPANDPAWGEASWVHADLAPTRRPTADELRTDIMVVAPDKVEGVRPLGSVLWVADFFGIGYTWARTLLSGDHAKARQRKQGYRRPCPGYGGQPCGRLMDGSNGRQGPRLCHVCQGIKQHAERPWKQAQVVEVFQAFYAYYGRSPSAADTSLAPSLLRKYSPARCDEILQVHADAAAGLVPWLPHPSVVQRECGSWAAALALAGLPPNKSGGRAHRGPYQRKQPGPKGGTGVPGEVRGHYDAVLQQRYIRVRAGFVCPRCGEHVGGYYEATGWCAACTREAHAAA